MNTSHIPNLKIMPTSDSNNTNTIPQESSDLKARTHFDGELALSALSSATSEDKQAGINSLPSSSNSNNNKRPPNSRTNTNNNLQQSAHFDGELALSVLSSRPRDANTGRRLSVNNTPVGAVSSNDDKKLKQKLKEEARYNIGSNSTRGSSNVAFEDRLKRKMSEGSSSSKRRSSRMSVSSLGDIEENKQVTNKSEDDNLVDSEKTQDVDITSNLKPSPNETDNNIDKDTLATKRLSRRLSSNESLTEDEYEDFIKKKVSERAPQTYSERKRREAEAYDNEEEEKDEISNTTTDGVNITADEVASDEGETSTDNRTTRFAMYTPVSQDSGRIKTITTDVCDREDMVDTSDNAPNELAEVVVNSTVEAQSNRRRSTTAARANRGVASSFTAVFRGNRAASSFTAGMTPQRSGPPRSASLDYGNTTRQYALGTNAALREIADMVEAQDVIEAHLVEEETPIETVQAIPMDDEEDKERIEKKRRKLKKQIVLVWTPLLLVIIVIVAVVVVVVKSNKSDSDNDGDGGSAEVQERVYEPTLIQVRNEGVLRCGLSNKYGFGANLNNVTGEYEGFTVDLCKAVAAAVLGEEYKIEVIDVSSLTRFTMLAGRDIDLLMWGDTHTMERDFDEKATRDGFQFSDPFFYDGLGFAGKPLFVQCADSFNWLGGVCKGLKVCANAGTTHVPILRDVFPSSNIVALTGKDFIQGFVDGRCNVLAGEQNDISETSVRIAGYNGDYIYGDKALSKEPLAMVTRKNDQSFSDAVNWVLRSLIQAELSNITSSNAEELMDNYASSGANLDVASAIKAVGNYGDIYNRHMQDVVPRKGLNLLYDTNVENQVSGLQYSHPFGTIDAPRYEFALDGKINTILTRGKLICGVIGDTTQSIETDYCRAISASLFSSDTSLVDIVQLSNEDDLLNKLDSGEVDVIAGASVVFQNDIIPSNTTSSGLSGLAFSQPYLYMPPSPPRAMATSQSDIDWAHFVYWVVANLIWAEEGGIKSSDFREVPEVELFGEQFEWMFRGSILGVGNYDEIYKRNSESLPPRSDQNLLNDGSSPQLWRPQL